MTAEEVKKLLGLKPHPREGGWYVRTYEARSWLRRRSLRMGGMRVRGGRGRRSTICWSRRLSARCIGCSRMRCFIFMRAMRWRCCS